MLSEERLNQISLREARASKGPWEFSTPEGQDWTQQARDYEFIAHAREDIPALLEMVKELKSCNEELQSLDGMQQVMIEKLNHEISRLRESVFVLEDQQRRNLALNLSGN